MPRVLHDETNIVLLRKFNACGSVLPRSHFDGVGNVVAKQARRCVRGEWIAAAVLLPWIHDGRWRLLATLGLGVFSFVYETCGLLKVGKRPQVCDVRTFSGIIGRVMARSSQRYSSDESTSHRAVQSPPDL